MNETADYVIVGGGIHGATLAFNLALRKAGKIVLLEKGKLASGPTGHSGAMVRPLFTERTYIELVSASMRVFQDWGEIVGGDSVFVQNGWLRITPSLDPRTLVGDLSLVDQLNIPYEIIDLTNLKSMFPTFKYCGNEVGLLFREGGYVDPVSSTRSLGQAAIRLGAEVREGVSVSNIKTDTNGVSAIVTDSGLISTRHVINCAGSWSHRIAEMVGVKLPIEIHRTATGMFQRPDSFKCGMPVVSDGINKVYLRDFGRDIVRVAHFGFPENEVNPDLFDESISGANVRDFREKVKCRDYNVGNAPSYGGFSALYDMTPDAHPIIGPVGEVNGFWCNCGWSGNGFASSPAIGRALAQMLLGEQPEIDIGLFAWPRDCSVNAREEFKWVHR